MKRMGRFWYKEVGVSVGLIDGGDGVMLRGSGGMGEDGRGGMVGEKNGGEDGVVEVGGVYRFGLSTKGPERRR